MASDHLPRSRSERLAAYLRDIAGEDGVAALRVDAEAVEGMKLARRSQENLAGIERALPSVSAKTLNSALESVATGRELTRELSYGLEAIIIPDKRPAMPLQGGTYTASHKLWLHLNEAAVRERLTKAAKSIGRIEVPGSRYPYGGTGFVVAPGLIMTNRHVAEIFVAGVGDRRLSFVPGISPGFSRSFAPSNDEAPPPAITGVRMVHPYWDMALLEVEGLTAEPLVLVPQDIAGFDKAEIAVIGYPAYDPRNDPDVQSRLFDNRFGIKQLLPGRLRERRATESYGKMVDAVTHDSSTLGGNSGSGLIHIASGKVLGLHFGGEYLSRNFAVAASDLAADARVVDAGVQFDPAVRPTVPPSWSGYWAAADSGEGSVVEAPETGIPVPGITPPAARPAELNLVIPVSLRISTGPDGTITASISGSQTLAATTERMVEPAHDADYSSRTGYNPRFLGPVVPLPEPKDATTLARTRSGAARLDYQNFSVLMHARRRLALISAANVTAEVKLRKPEPEREYTRKALSGLGENDMERWFPDPRLDARFQLPDVFYTKDDAAFDKGHIVRRDDVAWGKSYAELQRANGDTYHVTNCSPQVSVFNQSARGRENWGDLENLVLKQAASERLCVFAGPVLDAGDPRFLGNFGQGQRQLVQIPVKFWKVIVAAVSGGIATFAFVLEQDLSEVETTEFAVPEAFQPYLVPLNLVAAMAGIVFAPALLEADQFDARGPELALRASIGRKRGGS